MSVHLYEFSKSTALHGTFPLFESYTRENALVLILAWRQQALTGGRPEKHKLRFKDSTTRITLCLSSYSIPNPIHALFLPYIKEVWLFRSVETTIRTGAVKF
jgi:hypothetical protein